MLWLPSLFGGDEDEDQQKAELQVLVAEANEAAKFARQWRNQLVAHVDLERARDGVTHFLRDKRPAVAEPLEPATLEKMDRALEAVHRALDTALQYHYDSEKGMSLQPAAVTLEIGTAVFERASRLVEAVQFIDALVDPGPRIVVRFFGGWDYAEGDAGRSDAAATSARTAARPSSARPSTSKTRPGRTRSASPIWYTP